MSLYVSFGDLLGFGGLRKSGVREWSSRKTVPSFAVLLVILSVFLVPGQSAAEQEWVIQRVTGVVYLVAPGVQAVRAKKGMVLEKGYTLGTRSGAKALLARGEETISVGPSTTFALSRHRSKGGKTTLLQRSGVIEVDVQKRARPHFTVETPFMAAVVKGTRFEVSVSETKASVAVERGVVGVEDFATGDNADLTAGQNAVSEPSRTVGLTVGGTTKAVVRSGKKRAPAFQAPNAVQSAPGGKSGAASENSNSGGNGKGKSGSNSSGGNGNSKSGSGNNNAGGNSNGNGNSGNSNAGGNGNSNSGSGNNNAGGNSNGNGNSGNSNAGGNGKGKGNNN